MFRQPNPVPIVAGHADLRPGDLEHRRITDASERAVDQALADSFPASDPPPWTLGVVYAPSEFHAIAGLPRFSTASVRDEGAPPPDPVKDVIILDGGSRARRTPIQWLMTLAGVMGLVLLVPFAILIIGLPVALAVRGIVEAVTWLAAFVAN
jgi:hypothetical protein